LAQRGDFRRQVGVDEETHAGYAEWASGSSRSRTAGARLRRLAGRASKSVITSLASRLQASMSVRRPWTKAGTWLRVSTADVGEPHAGQRVAQRPFPDQRFYLLDPHARERVGDWARIASETVAILRFEAARYPSDRKLADLVGELTLQSPEFIRWWNDHSVMRRTHGAKHYHHPLVGDLHFTYESFQAPGDTEQTLCVYNVEPGSPTAQALQVLGSWNAPEPTGPDAPRSR
jgi:MmyB-like transcription regulator ligand binding domain